MNAVPKKKFAWVQKRKSNKNNFDKLEKYFAILITKAKYF